MLIKTFTKKLDGLKFAVHTNCLIWHIQREKKTDHIWLFSSSWREAMPNLP